ncbi:MAG: EamA family transporter [Alphaproteobacteria bacterium]
MPAKSRNLMLGILAGIATGMLWGIVFIVPQALPEFTPLELSLGRYFFFGLASCFTLKRTWGHFKSFTLRDKWQVFWLSAAGFWLYTILLFWAVNEAGGILATLVIGLLPITIPLVAKKTWRIGAVFAGGLALLFAGLLVLQVTPLLQGAAPTLTWKGAIPLLSCLVLWTWFGIKNTDFVQKYPAAKVSLTNLMGISSFIILAVIGAVMVDMKALFAHEHFWMFVFWSAVIGVGSSWAANILWNICSSHCTASISGPLVVAETSFGVIYCFMFEKRLPEAHEAVALLLFGLGVALAIKAEIKLQMKLQPVL